MDSEKEMRRTKTLGFNRGVYADRSAWGNTTSLQMVGEDEAETAC
jgi:hypothetical protein